MLIRRVLSIAAAFALPVAGVVALASPSSAANGTGTWASWTESSSNAGTISIASAGFPSGSVSTVGATYSTAKSSYINQNTPPGVEFGSSSGSTYAGVATRIGSVGATTTTTITFDSASPSSGWGIVLGDVDAESVKVEATTATGGTVNTSGWFNQAFNYCVTPKPGSCPAGSHTDVPTWNSSTSTLVGNVNDTSGASGWLTPNASVKTITFTQTVLAGAPAYQIWLVSNVNTAPPGGTCSANTPFDTAVSINCAAAFVDPEDGMNVTTGALTGPANGTATVSGGVISYTPNKGFSGTDTITIPVIDSMGATGTVTVTIVVRPDESPVVIPPGGSGPIDVIQIAGGGEGSTITSVDPPSHGSAVIQGDVVIYTPNSGYVGNDSVTAVVKTADGSDVSVTVSVWVGKAQEPVKPLGLPKKVKKSGTTVLLDHRVKTNAGQNARVHVTCTPLLRSHVTGDVKPCVVKRAGGRVSVTTSGTRVSVTLELSAPAKGAYSEYRETHSWVSKK